jgi:DNA polymerase I-like protein with 3'-5' exonuclease and polymerase domains
MNEASNFPPQSISSDLTLHVAIRNWRWLLERKVRIVNLVHDSLIMEVPITPLHSLRYEVINHMTQEFEQVPRDYGIDQIPFVTDAEVGHRWGSLIDIKKLPPGA